MHAKQASPNPASRQQKWPDRTSAYTVAGIGLNREYGRTACADDNDRPTKSLPGNGSRKAYTLQEHYQNASQGLLIDGWGDAQPAKDLELLVTCQTGVILQ